MTRKKDNDKLQDETELTLEDAENIVGGTLSNGAEPQGIWDFSKKAEGITSQKHGSKISKWKMASFDGKS